MADVIFEVEARIVDPERPPHLNRRESELLPEARDEMEARANLREQVLVAGRRPLEDQHRPDVHVAGGALLREEGRVDGGEAIQVPLSHR